jgi:hypothetical protein
MVPFSSSQKEILAKPKPEVEMVVSCNDLATEQESWHRRSRLYASTTRGAEANSFHIIENTR